MTARRIGWIVVVILIVRLALSVFYIRAYGAPSMDAYLPEIPTDTAVLVIHGGGWHTGSKAEARRACTEVVVPLGFACFAPDYRLAPEDPYPAANLDVLAAYRDVRAQGYIHIAAWGMSAGGNLAAWLATRVELETLVAWSPLTDLTRKLSDWWMVRNFAPRRGQRRHASPALAIPRTPSALIVNSRDELVPVAQARELGRTYDQRWVRVLDGSLHSQRYFDAEAAIAAAWLQTHLTGGQA